MFVVPRGSSVQFMARPHTVWLCGDAPRPTVSRVILSHLFVALDGNPGPSTASTLPGVAMTGECWNADHSPAPEDMTW
ncbi:hypothetical protein M758_N026300, partial [Ceratodon purpureus]